MKKLISGEKNEMNKKILNIKYDKRVKKKENNIDILKTYF